MSNDPQADLIYAILAMDSYNRGYGSSINGLDDDRAIGNVTILNFDLLAGSFAAGFYAIAYDWNGERAISYSNTIH